MKNLEQGALVLGGVGLGLWLMSRALRRAAYDFRGKVVLLTGGSRGLGLVMARQLVEQGARLAICARDAEELGRAADDLAGHGERPLAVPCDISNAGQVQAMVQQVNGRFGPIDVLINNAGVISVGPMETMTREDYELAMAVHFWGPYNTVDAVLPQMRQRQQGRIVNISSIGGKVAVPHLLPYCASKFALVGFSQGLRAEVARHGIAVTTVCPGLMRTGSPRHGLFKGQNEDEYTWFKVSDSIPLLTTSAERAARRILDGCRRGEAEVVLTLPAQLAILFNQVFPEMSSGLLSLANRLLPAPGGIGTQAREGKDSESSVSSWAAGLTDRAAERNNEIAPAER